MVMCLNKVLRILTIPTRQNTFKTKQIKSSNEWHCLRMIAPTCNSKLKYSHTITHDAAILGDLGQQPIALVPQKCFIFQLI